jgi:hypothetical protein
MNRAELRFLIESSFTAGRPDYARVLSTAWLAVSPGDLAVRFYFARALAAEKQVQDALKELAAIISVDYEHTAAYKLLATLAPRPPHPRCRLGLGFCARHQRQQLVSRYRCPRLDGLSPSICACY